MKLQIYLAIVFLYLGCSGQSEKPVPEKPIISSQNQTELTNKDSQPSTGVRINDLKELSTVQESDDYEAVKNLIERERSQLDAKGLQVDSVGKLFKESLLNKIIPFWEGTKWSFGGHTSIPKTGKIACGYFVSTTLKGIGLNLNRYKFAQQSPINEAKSLALNTEVKEFSEGSVLKDIAAINEYLGEGIHFIGFDQNHVGYILKEKNNLYLIHSNYLDAVGVVIEPIEESVVFSSYSKFYVVELSTNEGLLDSWKRKIPIQIVH